MKMGLKATAMLIAAAVLLTAVMPLEASAKAAGAEIADLWDYFSTNIEWTDSEMDIYGYFYNLNEDVDILGIEDFEMVLYDSAGKEMVSTAFENGGMLGEMVIPSGCTVSLTFTVSHKGFDESLFDFSGGYKTNIRCSFKYAECGGAENCRVCGGWRDYQFNFDEDEHESHTLESEAPSSDGYKVCGDCQNGFVECSYCGGTGKSATSGYSTGMVYGDIIMNSPCMYCGQGYNICGTCKGMGYVKDLSAVGVALPDGYEICEDCYKGYNRCSYCHGTGTKTIVSVVTACGFCQNGFKQCTRCGATGFIQVQQHPANNTPPPPKPLMPEEPSSVAPSGGNAYTVPSGKTTCGTCNGVGYKDCTVCDGSGYRTVTKRSIDLGYGSSTYDVREKCAACDYGRVRCQTCFGLGKN